MGLVTFQVLDGLEKGRTFTDLPTPVTIGREDDNIIRLNDERISRFHAKVQEDGGRFILTDLDSTNGTRVNGHPIQMRVLQVGDQLALGRSLLIFGSPEQLTARQIDRQQEHSSFHDPEGGHTVAVPDYLGDDNADEFAEEIEELFPNGPPEVPQGLRAVQAAQVSDVLAYAHREIAAVIDVAQQDEKQADMQVDWGTWQRLLKLEMTLAVYLRKIADPDA